MSDKKKKIIMIVSLGIFLYGLFTYVGLTFTMYRMHKELDIDQMRRRPVNLKGKEPFSILLLGIDTGDLGRTDTGRADSIVIVTVNPKENRTTMVSVPRDMYTKLANKKKTTKINEAYSYGGVSTLINTIQKKFDIPIDYYIQVNMQGLKEIVDSFGGVKVNNTLSFENYGYSFPKGKIKLNGDEALAYSTMRHQDPGGDYGRQERQRKIIEALIEKITSYRILFNQVGLYNSLGKNVQTSLEFNEIVTIQRKYNEALGNVEQVQVKGNGQMIGGKSFQIVSKGEIRETSELLKEELHYK